MCSSEPTCLWGRGIRLRGRSRTSSRAGWTNRSSSGCSPATPSTCLGSALVDGAHARIRTGDLLLTKEMLYRLSYVGGGSPTDSICYILAPNFGGRDRRCAGKGKAKAEA